MCYNQGLNTKKPDPLKDGLREFLHGGPRNLDECVEEAGRLLKRNGFKGSAQSDVFRMRVFETLHQLITIGYLTKDRSVKPALFSAA